MVVGPCFGARRILFSAPTSSPLDPRSRLATACFGSLVSVASWRTSMELRLQTTLETLQRRHLSRHNSPAFTSRHRLSRTQKLLLCAFWHGPHYAWVSHFLRPRYDSPFTLFVRGWRRPASSSPWSFSAYRFLNSVGSITGSLPVGPAFAFGSVLTIARNEALGSSAAESSSSVWFSLSSPLPSDRPFSTAGSRMMGLGPAIVWSSSSGIRMGAGPPSVLV